MKQIYCIALIGVTISGILGGCDVTSNDPAGTGGTQPVDPVVVDFPIAYIQRPVPIGFADEDAVQMTLLEDNILDPAATRRGATLILKDRASVSAPSKVLTEGIFPDTPAPEGAEDPTPIPALYDVRDLSINADGTKMAFAMRAPEELNDDGEDITTWNIWEYDIEEDTLVRVISSNIIANEGHDRFPTYLPDGSLVFSSTRQRTSKSMLLDQSRPQFAYVTESDDEIRAFTLHRIDEDRVEIEQISFGKGHDIYPTVIDSGQILYARGDDTSNRNRDRLSLYTMNPDGTNVSLHYGFHSESGNEDAPAITKPLQLENGDILASYRLRTTALLGGDIITVDTENYIDNTEPTSVNMGATGPAEASASFGEVVVDGQSPHGYFNSAYPIFDGSGRLLVSWMPCLVQGYRLNIYVRSIDTDIEDGDGVVIGVNTRYELINIDGEPVDTGGNLVPEGEPPVEITLDEIVSLPCTPSTFTSTAVSPSEPQFGIWIYDPETQTQDPVVFANEVRTMYTEAVVFEQRTPPTFIPDAGQDEYTASLVNENVGVINIRSVYDFDGQDVAPGGIAAMADPLQTPPDTRPVRFIRFWEESNLPHEDEYEFENDLIGALNNQPSRSILGYAQVHPDGSVMTKVPANVAFSLELLDANGRRVGGGLGQRHFNWLNLRPGEIRTCNGCHTANSTSPHGRYDAEPESANPGALAESQFPNTSLLNGLDLPYDPPEIGETMAEFYTRAHLADPAIQAADIDPIALSVDIDWTDEWTDTSVAVPAADIQMVYGVLDPITGIGGPNNLQTTPPVLIGECLTEWNALCRIVIDYPDHIQPMFEVTRTATVTGPAGDEIQDVTCINCHATVDPDGATQVPAPNVGNLQLDFTFQNNAEDPPLLKGYDEFFANGDPLQIIDPETGLLVNLREQVFIDGVPQYEQEDVFDMDGNPLFQATDQNGQPVCVLQDTVDPNITLVLDAMDNPIRCQQDAIEREADGTPILVDGMEVKIPLLEDVLQTRYLSAQRANAAQNDRFFAVFDEGGAHDGFLTDAELKLLSEWLDIGGQYYNELFKALDD